ncbi:MAG: ATP-dependent helicase [Candidatus Sericytochromatia bacterium]
MSGKLTEEERNNLLIDFRAKFLKKHNHLPSENTSSFSSSFGINLSSYIQPKISKETKEKIDKLTKIAKNIENNLFKEEDVEENNKYKINYKKSLNNSQYLAVKSINGPVLVIAGAGSGKTRTIIYRLSYLIENGIEPNKILLLTFTKKASGEMIDRASELLKDGKCNNVMGGTFHSFSNYLLRKYHKLLNILPNFTIIDTTDSEDIIDLIRQEMKFDKKDKAFPKKSRIQTIISRARNLDTNIENVIEKEYKGLKDFTEEIKILNQAFYEYKQVNNILDYDDLMEFLRDSLKNNLDFRKSVQKNFEYIMVDEFQDTNSVQKEIVDLLAESHKNIMVVGDDAQSIYGFRGANVENILLFPETYPDCKVIKIEQNYRSNQNILDFTNSIINNSLFGYKKLLFSDKTAPHKPIIKKFFSEHDEAKFIVDNILRLREKNVPLNQIAVLYRSSFHGNYIQAELTKKNIPYVVYGGIKFTERRHVKDIISYLRVIFNPYDTVSWNRILKIVPNVGNATASKIINHIQDKNGEFEIADFKGKKFYPELEKLQGIIETAKDEFIHISKKIEILRDYYAEILKKLEDDYAERLLDIDVIYDLSSSYEKLEKFLSDFALTPPSNKYQDKTTPLIDETEDKPVVLSTIHSAKGLEWHTVFVTHLLDGLLPSSMSLNKIEELEEERRLFYVACTRAKENLFLTLPASISLWDSFLTKPSRFIIEVDENKYFLER